ncbi:MAG: hypothetical protein LBU32_28975 [Clostridiales bacterium]|jgi:hypothetical protein|nr:hypothetical protein [Clostridiales bacterium]
MIIVDSRSAENADTIEIRGYDGGERISGAEIHIAAGVLGLLFAVAASVAFTIAISGCQNSLTGGRARMIWKWNSRKVKKQRSCRSVSVGALFTFYGWTLDPCGGI